MTTPLDDVMRALGRFRWFGSRRGVATLTAAAVVGVTVWFAVAPDLAAEFWVAVGERVAAPPRALIEAALDLPEALEGSRPAPAAR